MNDSIHLKYLIVNETDLSWGLTINSVGYQSITSQESYPPQNHPTRYLFSTEKGRILDEYQLLYITRGKGDFVSSSTNKNSMQPIKEGNMFLLFPGEWHNYMPDKRTGWDEYWIGFKGINIDNLVDFGFFNKQKVIFNIGMNSKIVELYKQAIQYAIEQKSGFQQILAGIVTHLLGLAYSIDKNSVFENSELANQINKAKVIILENFKEIKPKEVADNLNMSYSNFRKIFKEYTGFAPLQYIQELKVQKSKELLTNTTISIKEIAFLMGFENQEYFFTSFKKKTGITPLEYRKFTQGGMIER
ncbi:AraC family transcriptional regulator [Dysgonomonas sp. 521]|uniref:AraC family transcriptional regulator n=1 Tax=Dysgonomonas sp. 521 TaxID=2302932 RepID=UPI0013D62E35|nr:AraC family transcriptional regulator [Dysgonomonas sp. 521]NDV93977.1 AraC family transcriptional regulator [Dysgonomonas sp. 521]